MEEDDRYQLAVGVTACSWPGQEAMGVARSFLPLLIIHHGAAITDCGVLTGGFPTLQP